MRRGSFATTALSLLLLTGAVIPARADACDFDSRYVFAVTREVDHRFRNRALTAVASPLTLAIDLGLLPFELALGYVEH